MTSIKTHTIRIFPDDLCIDAEEGSLLGDVLRESFSDLSFPCGGRGRCLKCTFLLEEGRADEGAAVEQAQAPGRRFLACRFRVRSDVAIRPEFRPEGDPIRTERLETGTGRDAALPPAGMALDLGTTTLVLSVLDAEGRPLVRATAANPQQAFGADVMSRIAFARSDPIALELLQRSLHERLTRMADALCREAKVDPAGIRRLFAAGNTCMQHLFAGIDPAPLGVHPYEPASRFGGVIEMPGLEETVSPTRDGSGALGLAPDLEVYLAPIISGFVGGDIAAGVLATDLLDDPGTSLLVDVGTNGEILLARGGRATATSTAAGPAFEGASLSSGMPAGPGAIERVDLGEGLRLDVIGGRKPVGLCGTGVLSAAAGLLEQGIVDRSGRIAPPEAWHEAVRGLFSEHYGMVDGKPAFRLAPGVWITQEDVRQVQLAKAAVRAGIDLILEHADLSPGDVERVYVAGAFGRRLDTADAIAIGLFPPAFRDRALFVGNTSLAGAERLLARPGERESLARACGRVVALDLVEDGRFTDPFVKNLPFP